jgi:hypothetical protein
MAPSYTRLEDFRINSMNLGAECGNCGHRGVVEGPKLWRWFAVHRWDGTLAKIGEHMRCSVCRRRPISFAATPAEPSIDFGPKDEAGWQRLVQRLR